jgi:hypothetical protein
MHKWVNKDSGYVNFTFHNLTHVDVKVIMPLCTPGRPVRERVRAVSILNIGSVILLMQHQNKRCSSNPNADTNTLNSTSQNVTISTAKLSNTIPDQGSNPVVTQKKESMKHEVLIHVVFPFYSNSSHVQIFLLDYVVKYYQSMFLEIR